MTDLGENRKLWKRTLIKPYCTPSPVLVLCLLNPTAILWGRHYYSTSQNEKGPIEVKSFAQDGTALVKGSKYLHLPWSHLAPQPHPCYAWASRNWFALSAMPTRKSRGLVLSSHDSEQKSKERNCKVYPGSLSSSQCKQHHRLALQIMWGMKEHSSTVEGPCTHLGN